VEVFFSSCIWCGEWTVQCPLGHWTFHGSFIGGGQGGGARRGEGRFFFSSFPCFLMCSHGVPSKFLMGSQNVPQVHNVFLNMFFI
jgi:hypothetical protein